MMTSDYPQLKIDLEPLSST